MGDETVDYDLMCWVSEEGDLRPQQEHAVLKHSEKEDATGDFPDPDQDVPVYLHIHDVHCFM